MAWTLPEWSPVAGAAWVGLEAGAGGLAEGLPGLLGSDGFNWRVKLASSLFKDVFR